MNDNIVYINTIYMVIRTHDNIHLVLEALVIATIFYQTIQFPVSWIYVPIL